jgi:alpha-L-fucosidase
MADTDHPWEENRGMGYSYGYNRAERLEHYRTGRELVMTLVDTVSRGGNLLLDIGPDADGTIPVVMEDRLAEIGAWLAVNGEAIYGTRPFSAAKQWSEGEQPKLEYGKEYDSDYDVSTLVARPAPGKAAIEAFFTSKGRTVYAILPRWPGRRFVWKDAAALSPRAVSLLGRPGALPFTPAGATIAIDLPELPEELLGQPAWVLKLEQ